MFLTIHISLIWLSSLKLRLSNDVELNPGPKSPVKRGEGDKISRKKPESQKKPKMKRTASSVRDSGLSSASSASPSIPDDTRSVIIVLVNIIPGYPG